MQIVIDIPNNATNGDMIKAMFPNAKYQHIIKLSGVNYMMIYGINGLYDNQGNWCDREVSFNDDWWNSPYKTESEG